MEPRTIKAEALISIIFLLLSLWMIFFAIPSQISLSATWSTVDSGVNSQTFPYFAAVIMGSAALVQLIIVIKNYAGQRNSRSEQKPKRIAWSKELRAITVFIICAVYGFLFIKIGYIPATAVAPPLVLLVLGDRKWQHYLAVYGVGAAMYVIFQFLLKIRLP